MELYSNWRFPRSVLVVVILYTTSSFQTFFELSLTDSSIDPAGIWVLTLLQAWALEMKDMPTLDVIDVSLNVNTESTRAVEIAAG